MSDYPYKISDLIVIVVLTCIFIFLALYKKEYFKNVKDGLLLFGLGLFSLIITAFIVALGNNSIEYGVAYIFLKDMGLGHFWGRVRGLCWLSITMGIATIVIVLCTKNDEKKNKA